MRSFLNSVFRYLSSFIAFLIIISIYWHRNVLQTANIASHPTSLDAYHLYLPFYTFTAENLANLHIPLWNPYQMCGMSYIGVFQGAIFYPPVMLFAMVAPAKAYSLYLMLHIALGGFFVLLLCRAIGISWLASWAGALTFMLCSNTVSRIFGPAFLANSIYFPLMLLFVLKIFHTGKMKWTLALTLAAALPLFAGWIQALVYSFYALGLFVAALIIRQLWRKPAEPFYIKRGLLLILWSATLFLLLTSIQALPVIEAGKQATRSFSGLSEEMVTIKNTAMYSPYRLAYDTFNSKGGFLPFYLYVGAVPLLLSIAAFWHRRFRFFVLFFWGLAIGAMILSMGPQTLIFKAWMHLPLNSMFRAPFRILFLHAVSLSLLCSVGLDYLLQRMTTIGKKEKKFVSFAAMGAASIFILLIFIWPAPGADLSPAMKVINATSLWRIYLLAFSLLVLLCSALPIPSRLNRLLIGFGCIGIIVVDLFSANHNLFYIPEKNPEIYDEHSHVVETLKGRTGKDHSRVFIASDLTDYSYCVKLGQLSGLSLIDDYENMNPTRYNRFCNYMFGKHDRRSIEFFWGWFNLDDTLVHPEFLDLMSTKYIWCSKGYLQKDSKSAMTNYAMLAKFCVPIYEDEKDSVLLNPKALPRAYIVGKSRVIADEEETLKLLGSEDFSPENEVILSNYPGRSERDGEPCATKNSEATMRSIKPEEIRIDVRLDGSGFLVLTDQYYPGWETSVDTVPAPILRANYLFRAVPLTAGEHEIVFRYRPKSFRVGAAASCLGLLLMLASLVGMVVRRPND